MLTRLLPILFIALLLLPSCERDALGLDYDIVYHVALSEKEARSQTQLLQTIQRDCRSVRWSKIVDYGSGEREIKQFKRGAELDTMIATWLKVDRWYHQNLRDGVCVWMPDDGDLDLLDEAGRVIVGEFDLDIYYAVEKDGEKKLHSMQGDLEHLSGLKDIYLR